MSIPIRANPLGYDSWFVKVTRAFNNSIGEPGKVRSDYVPGNPPVLKVFVNLDVSLTSVEQLKLIAGNSVPSGVSVKWYWDNGLPMSYSRAEWIETVLPDYANAPYLSTGIIPTSETSCKIRCMWTDPTYINSHVTFWFAPRPEGNGKNSYSLLSRSSSGAYLSYNYGSQSTPWWDYITQSRNTWQTIETRKNTLWVNGTLRKTYLLDYFTASGPLYTNIGNAGIPAGRGCNRISEFKIWDDSGDLANYIPAFNSLGETGMYDTVSKSFKVSASKTTTAQFTVGLTLQQVRDMKLNAPGSISSLSLSIPCEVYNDSEAWGVIEAAQQNGWAFTFYWTNVVAYLTPHLNDIVGSGKYTIAYDYQKSILDIAIDTSVSPVAVMNLQELFETIVPDTITTQMQWSDGVPMSYTRLDYLESSYVQCIDTGIKTTGDSEISVDVTPVRRGSDDGYVDGSNVNMIYGSCSSGSEPAGHFISFGYNGGHGNATYVKYGTQRNYQIDAGFGNHTETVLRLGKRYSLTQNKNNYIQDGFVSSKSFNTLEFTSANNLVLFKNLQSAFGSVIRIHSFKFKNTVDECNYIPALYLETDNPDIPVGTPGMYDTVSKTFKTNDGTGQFTIGMTLDQVISLKLPVAPATPNNKLTLSVPGEAMYRQDAQKVLNAAAANGWELTIQYRDIETPEFQGYVVADYIEKPTGAYTYINTGLSQRLLGYFDYMNTECNQTSDYRYIWGIWPMQSNGRGSIWVQKSDSKIWLYALTEVNCEINTRHDLVHVLCARRLGDSSSSTYVGLGIDGSWPAYTKDWPIPDGVTETYRMFAQRSTERLYSARFTDIEHKDIASFIPAIDPDGNPCMFDFVRKQPFYNASGTNKFAFTIGLTQEQAESLVLGDKGSGLTIQVPEGTDLEVMQANNPNVTITIQTIPATTN